MQKRGLLEADKNRMQLALQVMDKSQKHRSKTLIVSVPKAVYKRNAPVSSHLQSPTSQVSRSDMNRHMAASMIGMPVTEAFVGQGAFVQWIENLKISQRPIWSKDDEGSACFVCAAEFGFFERRNNCRRCGTAVCGPCSKYFVPLPELGYYERVRICVTCIKEIYRESRTKELI